MRARFRRVEALRERSWLERSPLDDARIWVAEVPRRWGWLFTAVSAGAGAALATLILGDCSGAICILWATVGAILGVIVIWIALVGVRWVASFSRQRREAQTHIKEEYLRKRILEWIHGVQTTANGWRIQHNKGESLDIRQQYRQMKNNFLAATRADLIAMGQPTLAEQVYLNSDEEPQNGEELAQLYEEVMNRCYSQWLKGPLPPFERSPDNYWKQVIREPTP